MGSGVGCAVGEGLCVGTALGKAEGTGVGAVDEGIGVGATLGKGEGEALGLLHQ